MLVFFKTENVMFYLHQFAPFPVHDSIYHFLQIQNGVAINHLWIVRDYVCVVMDSGFVFHQWLHAHK